MPTLTREQALLWVRDWGVNSRAELVTLAPGLRPERRFAPLARGQKLQARSLNYPLPEYNLESTLISVHFILVMYCT